jgi:hypothetical protein
MRDDPTSAGVVEQQVGQAARDLCARVQIGIRQHLPWW